MSYLRLYLLMGVLVAGCFGVHRWINLTQILRREPTSRPTIPFVSPRKPGANTFIDVQRELQQRDEPEQRDTGRGWRR